MITILVGKTASGKDSIRSVLINKYNMSPVITYTTRPMRNGEKDGVSYHFVSDDKFNEMKANNMFAETTSYTVADGSVWQYGTPIEELKDDKVIILNPDGLKSIKAMNIDCMVFYIKVSSSTIKSRLKLRGDDEKEANRRMLADKNDFEGIEKYVDFIITNEGGITPEIAAYIVINELELKERKNERHN